ncbi:multidrug effflux MFS transporter [Marinobacter bohaiensis]|uniref:multidrug effflux MFS transporter n=1 Tax=Marinobacter bohaiensis TaxID=2201898 RepID=UPI000DAF3BD9|nr:multidrug effflux MFS transporter [Marinobacter bohaiensis]
MTFDSGNRRQRVQLIVVLGILSAASSLGTDIYLPGLPALTEEFRADPAVTQYSLSLFFIGLAVGQFLYGPIADRYGRKPVLYFGFTLYLLGCVAGALAGSVTTLILARALQGLGAATGQVIPRAIVRDRFSGAQAARVISFVIMVMAIAPLVAPLIGSLVLSVASWRAIFWLLAAYATLGLLASALWLGESHGVDKRARHGSLPAQYLGYFELLQRGPFPLFLACGVQMFAVLFAFVSASSFIYIDQFGVDDSLFGFYFSFNMIAMLLGNLINGRLVVRYGYLPMLGIAVSNTLIWSIVLLVMAVTGVGGLWGIVIPAFLMLLTVSMAGANTIAGLLDLAPDTAGAASALFGVTQFGCAALAASLVGALGSDAVAMASVTCAAATGATLTYRLLRRRLTGTAVEEAA